MQSRSLIARALGLMALAALLVMNTVIGGMRDAAPVAAAQPRIGGEFVARLGASDSFIGLVAGQGKVLAFVCNGTAAGVSTWGWFRGDLVGDQLQLTNASGQVLELSFAQADLVGRFVLPNGAAEDFRAQRATGDAGLFAIELTAGNQVIEGGWVVDDTRDFRGQIALRELDEATRTPIASPGDLPQFAGTGNFDPSTHSAFLPVIDESRLIERVTGENLLAFFD